MGKNHENKKFSQNEKIPCWSVCCVASLYNVVSPFACRSCHLP